MNSFNSARKMYSDLPVYLKNKIDYLRDRKYTGSTCKDRYRVFFATIYDIEKLKNKDLSQFNKEDVIELIQSIPTSHINTLRYVLSVIRGYEVWAIENGLNHSGEDPTQNIKFKEIAIVNVAKLKNNYISYDELFNLWENVRLCKMPECDKITAQNFALLLLIRMGLFGKSWSEVLYLEKSDIDFDKKVIHVTNRTADTIAKDIKPEIIKDIDIKDDRILKILAEALNVKSYTYEKGVAKSKILFTKYFEDSDFVIKREVGYSEITPTILRNRLTVLFKCLEESYIAPRDLFRCAELDMLLEIKEQSDFDKLYVNDFMRVHKHFEPNATTSGYTSLKEIYSSITGDSDILKDNWLVDDNGNRMEFVPDYSKYRR